MGLFNLFKKKDKEELHTAAFPAKDGKQGYYGDLENTALLTKLFEVTKEKRDENWNHKFLTLAADASFACGNPQIIQGPDGFPYFQLETPPGDKPFQCFVISHMIFDFILERGIGIVIIAHSGLPAYVFTYGIFVNFTSRNALF